MNNSNIFSPEFHIVNWVVVCMVQNWCYESLCW